MSARICQKHKNSSLPFMLKKILTWLLLGLGVKFLFILLFCRQPARQACGKSIYIIEVVNAWLSPIFIDIIS